MWELSVPHQHRAGENQGGTAMATARKPDETRPVETCLAELLDLLGIASAHFAGRGSADLQGFASTHPERIASLTLLCPAVLDTRTLAPLAERLLVVTGDHGPGARRVQAGLPDLPQATAVVLGRLRRAHLGGHRRRAGRQHRRGDAAIPGAPRRRCRRPACRSRKAKSPASPFAFAAPDRRWCCCRSICPRANGSR